MGKISETIWFVIGNGAVARRGTVSWVSDDLIRFKISQEDGRTRLVTYLKSKIDTVERW